MTPTSPGVAPTILVVDDDEAWRAVLRDAFEREGFQVVEESRGDRTVASVRDHRPDVVVLDDQVPGTQGLELLVPLRQGWPEIPIVLMTAFGGAGTARTALRLGASRYFDKPFRLGHLVGEIRRLVADRPGPPWP